MNDWPSDGWELLVRQPDLDRPGLEAWLGKHDRYQYNVTVWVDGDGAVRPEVGPTYAAEGDDG